MAFLETETVIISKTVIDKILKSIIDVPKKKNHQKEKLFNNPRLLNSRKVVALERPPIMRARRKDIPKQLGQRYNGSQAVYFWIKE